MLSSLILILQSVEVKKKFRAQTVINQNQEPEKSLYFNIFFYLNLSVIVLWLTIVGVGVNANVEPRTSTQFIDGKS